MNFYCNKYGLSCTYFDSPHGLQNVENVSNAADMAKLTAIAMQNETFRKIVSTRVYETEVRRVANITDTLRGICRSQIEKMPTMSALEQKKMQAKLSSEIFYDQYMQYLDRYNHSNKG